MVSKKATTKSYPKTEDTITHAKAGNQAVAVSEANPEKPVPRPRPRQNFLTEREIEVLRLLVDGYSNGEAAQRMGLSNRTVEAHRARIMLKLNIHELPGLVKYSIIQGITSVHQHRQD